MKDSQKKQYNNLKEINNHKKDETKNDETTNHNTKNTINLLEKTCKYCQSLMVIMIISFYITVSISKSNYPNTRSDYFLNTIYIFYIILNIIFLITSFILIIIWIFNKNKLNNVKKYFLLGLNISIFPFFWIIGCSYSEPILCIVGTIAGITIIYCIIWIIICAITQLITKMNSK